MAYFLCQKGSSGSGGVKELNFHPFNDYKTYSTVINKGVLFTAIPEELDGLKKVQIKGYQWIYMKTSTGTAFYVAIFVCARNPLNGKIFFYNFTNEEFDDVGFSSDITLYTGVSATSFNLKTNVYGKILRFYKAATGSFTQQINEEIDFDVIAQKAQNAGLVFDLGSSTMLDPTTGATSGYFLKTAPIMVMMYFAGGSNGNIIGWRLTNNTSQSRITQDYANNPPHIKFVY